MRIFVGLLTIGVGLSSAASATSLLQHEPARGTLPAGQSVFVDNGKCAHGKVLEVTGGGDKSLRTGNTRTGSNRTYKCVTRPS